MVNSARPVIGRYSLSPLAAAILSSACGVISASQRGTGSTHRFDTRQHIGLAVAVAVGANTEVDLAGVPVGLERLGHTCQLISNQQLEFMHNLHPPRIGSGGPAGTADQVDTVRRERARGRWTRDRDIVDGVQFVVVRVKS